MKNSRTQQEKMLAIYIVDVPKIYVKSSYEITIGQTTNKKVSKKTQKDIS